MDSLAIVGRLILFLTALVFPQLFGALLYVRLNRYCKVLARVLAALAPAILFFFLSPSFFFAGIEEAQARGELNCGMPALGALMLLFFFTAFELAIGLIVQVCWWHITARKLVP